MGGGGGQMARSNAGGGTTCPSTHLFSDQVIKQSDHTHSQHLCALCLYQTPQDLQPPEFQELLLGVGEVSQEGAQRKQDLQRVRSHAELALP